MKPNMFSRMPRQPSGKRGKLGVVLMALAFGPALITVPLIALGAVEQFVYLLLKPIIPVLVVGVVLVALYWVIFRRGRR